jgi:hypothetical protein
MKGCFELHNVDFDKFALCSLPNGVVLRFCQGVSKISALISLDVLHIAIILQLIVMLMMPFLPTNS